MMTRIVVAGVTFVLAWAFAVLGDLILRRRAHGLQEWNESMLIGLGVCAAALFPLTILFPANALNVVAAAVITAVVLRVRIARYQRPQVAVPRLDILSLIFLLVVAGCVVGFSVLDMRHLYVWDGYQIWATKAMLLYHHGGLTRTFLNSQGSSRLMLYPNMVPLFEAMLAKTRGHFNWDELKPIFIVFYVSLALSMFSAARSFASRTISFAATAVVLLLPEVSWGASIGGYADMPQAAVLAAFLAAILPDRNGNRKGLATTLLLCGLTQVKSEGSTQFSVICAAILVYWWVRRSELPLRARLAENRAGILVVLIFAILRPLYTWWIGAPETNFVPITPATVRAGLERIPEVARLCAAHTFDWNHWALFWPSVTLSVIVVLIFGNAKLRLVSAGTIVSVLSFMGIFLFTRWSIPLHINQAYNRLLGQISPAAVITIVAAYQIAIKKSEDLRVREPERSGNEAGERVMEPL
jgi:hypothetical protein